MKDTTLRAQVHRARTFLFAPGHKPERFGKAAASDADIVILDLEDAVAASDKQAARNSVVTWLNEGNPAIVRVNAQGTRWHENDVRAVAATGAGIMLPKASDPEILLAIGRLLGAETAVVPLIETAAGVARAVALSSVDGVTRTAFGSIDLATELGVAPDDREALAYTRGALVVAAAAAGIAPPIDGVTTALREIDTITSDVRYATRLGMTGKLCIHPSQIAPVHAAMSPSSESVTWAESILAATSTEGSAVAVDGHMVDAPVVERARRILAAAK